MTTLSVDFDALRRQTFGGMFDRSARDRAAADEILSGKIALRPHPVWEFDDDVDWQANPFGQRNWQAQLQMLRWLEPVRRVAMDGDEKARQFWIRMCKSWVAANPSSGYQPKDAHGGASYAWADMVEAMRALVLTFGLPLVEEDDRTWLLDSIVEHGTWLADPKHLGHSNHALHQHQALFVIGLVLGHDSWTQLAIQRLTELFEESYDDEGVNVEGAIAYHKNNLIWWEQAFKRLDVEGIPRPASASRLDLAHLELAHATKPDGTFELIGDTELSGPTGLSSPELDYVRTEGAMGQPPSDLTKIYRQGYVFGRSGWGDHERDFRKETFYSLSFGKANRVHGHQDGASLTLHSNGHPWLIDAGKYAYKQDAMRDYCLSRLGHNVVHIDGRTYDRKADVALLRAYTSDEVDDFTFVDTGYQDVTLKRRVVYCRGGEFLVVIDSVFSKKEITASQRWHIDAETAVDPVPGGFQLTKSDASAWIVWKGNMPSLSTVCGSEEPFDGWMAREWMDKKASPVITASQTGLRFRFITVIASPASGQFSVKKLQATGGRMSVTAQSGRHQFNLAVDEDGARVTLGDESDKPPATQDLKSAWMKTLDLCREAEVAWTAPKPAEGTFRTSYWDRLKTWIDDQPNRRSARLEALGILLDLLLDVPANSGDDQGLRAAVVDVLGTDLGEEVGLTPPDVGILREPLLAWSGGADLHSKTYKRDIRTIKTVDELVLNDGESAAIFAASRGGLVLPFAVGRGSTDLLSVRFHGAINRTKTTLPFFQGLTSEAAGNDNYALFQDPSLDLNKSMTLAWYLGDGTTDIHRYMAECIAKIQSETGAARVLLSGSSGGGFAAMQVASYLPDSVALVFNPQTDVKEYFRTSADTALASCLQENGGADGPRDFSKSTSVVSNYSELEKLPQVLYVQNTGDKHHVLKHRDPFLKMLESEHESYSDRIRFIDVDWGAGHVAATAELQAKYRGDALNAFQ
ncbi:heparinase II/III family protein [Pseudarthrobacter oxydans]|uniref:heparinase II/III family protein n=1 Tax=Pseudarthrobacter oxydans TaxID=1671 RepID=UPI003D2A9DEE